MRLLFGTQIAVAETPADNAAAMRLLKMRCFSCHNEQKSKGGLVMTSQETLQKGGDNGAVIVAGNPMESALIKALAPDADPHMPPKKQLSAAQIETLSAWIKAGAAWDAAALVDKPREVKLAGLPAKYQPVLALALSPDGKRLAASCGNEIVLYDVAEKAISLGSRAKANADAVQSLAWSPDGTRLATGAFRRVIVWNASELIPERVISDGLTDRITALRFLPDGQRLVFADGRIAENGTVRIADIASATVKTSWPAHGDTIFDLAISADGKSLATAGADHFVKIWELETQKENARIEAHATQVLTLAFNADATLLFTGGADQQLKAWDVKSRDQVMLLGQHKSAVNALAFAPTGPLVFAVTESGELVRYSDFKPHTGAQSSDSANERKLEGIDDALYCIAVSANGERVFAGTHDGRVLGWNKDGKLITKTQVREPAATAAK